MSHFVIYGLNEVCSCFTDTKREFYLDANSSTQIWKIVGIVLGAIVMIIGIILILLTILKQTRKRPWQYKKQKNVSTYDDEFYSDEDDDDDDDVESIVVDDVEDAANDSKTGQKSPAKMNASNTNDTSENGNSKTREMALSPIGGSGIDLLQKSSSKDEMIYCPGCNRVHPTSHQCMYSTHIANTFGHQIRPIVRAAPQDSIAIQTDNDTEPKKKKKSGPHTVIDRTLKYSYNTETQTDVTAKPGANVTESIILRRVPIPTAKVVVQQPTTKVMIVKVPNKSGQLVIQPKPSDS